MGKHLLFFLTVILFLLVISAAVSADQDGNYRYCNRDQYGCWVTEDDGRRSYIMFWSEEIKNNFIGKDKRAVICDPPESNTKNTISLGESPQPAKPAPVKPAPQPELE